jgi:uncharacterized membrane protein
LPFINQCPIALDEPFSIFYAQQDIIDFLPEINQGNNSPLHFVLLHFWIKIFGISPFSVRSLSLLFSIISIPILYRLSKFGNLSKIGILVCLIYIFSRFNHFHALEARMYGLFILFFLLIIYNINQIIFYQKSRYVTLVILNVLLLYTHYLSVFVVLTEFIIIIIYSKSFLPHWKKIISSIVITTVFFWPGLMVLMNRTKANDVTNSWVPIPSYTELYGNVIRFFNNTVTFSLVIVGIIIMILVFKTYQSNFLKKFLHDQQFKFYLLLFLIPYLSMFGFSMLVQSVFLDRYILFTSIPLYILLGRVVYLTLASVKPIFLFLLVAPMVISVRFIPQTNRNPELIAQFINDNNKSDSLKVYVSPVWINLAILYHYNREAFQSYNEDLSQSMPNFKGIYNLEEINLESNFILVSSKEGWIDNRMDIESYFQLSHTLVKYDYINGMYHLFKFKLKNDKL